MIKIGVIIMALVSFLNAGWFANLFDSTPTPPVAVPIDLSKKGSTAEVVIRSDDSDKSRYFQFISSWVCQVYQLTTLVNICLKRL